MMAQTGDSNVIIDEYQFERQFQGKKKVPNHLLVDLIEYFKWIPNARPINITAQWTNVQIFDLMVPVLEQTSAVGRVHFVYPI